VTAILSSVCNHQLLSAARVLRLSEPGGKRLLHDTASVLWFVCRAIGLGFWQQHRAKEFDPWSYDRECACCGQPSLWLWDDSISAGNRSVHRRPVFGNEKKTPDRCRGCGSSRTAGLPHTKEPGSAPRGQSVVTLSEEISGVREASIPKPTPAHGLAVVSD